MTTLLLITSVRSMVVQNGLFGYVTKKKLRENRAILSFTIFAYGVCVIAIGLVCGVCTFAMNFINLKLSGLLPSQLFFPLVNGSAIVLSAIMSVVLFRERLTKRQTVPLMKKLTKQ